MWKEVDYRAMSEKEKQLLVQEVNLLRELRHPNIVRYHDRIIDRDNSTLYIIMEYCEVLRCVCVHQYMNLPSCNTCRLTTSVHVLNYQRYCIMYM